jgi:serine/threonine protein phosphatase 1
LRWKLSVSELPKSKARVPAGWRIYAVGDVHGRADLLTELFNRIDSDLNARPIAKSIQIFLGDYIDRGPHSRQVIDLLIARRQQGETVFLKGNHEACALLFLEDRAKLSDWKELGGASTLLSYGVTPANRDDPQSQQQAATAFRQALPADHRQFIQNLRLSYTCGGFFFVHAGVRPGIPLERQSERDLLWIRDDFLLHEEDFGKVVVHGHTPAHEPDVRPNRINIDTGAYATGRLTCMVLEGDQMRFL